MMQWILVHPYTIWKKCVFNLEINISTVLAIRMSSGNSFHVLTVAMLNARSPYVMSFVLDSSKRRGSSDDRRPLYMTFMYSSHCGHWVLSYRLKKWFTRALLSFAYCVNNANEHKVRLCEIDQTRANNMHTSTTA